MDKEDLARTKLALTEEEAKEEKVKQKQYGDVDKVVGRRKNGRTLEYECTWIGQGEKSVDPRRKNSAKMVEENKYIALETMIEMGYQKQVLECDARIAAANAGLDLRPLITAEIQGHLDDFALDAEFGKSLFCLLSLSPKRSIPLQILLVYKFSFFLYRSSSLSCILPPSHSGVLIIIISCPHLISSFFPYQSHPFHRLLP